MNLLSDYAFQSQYKTTVECNETDARPCLMRVRLNLLDAFVQKLSLQLGAMISEEVQESFRKFTRGHFEDFLQEAKRKGYIDVNDTDAMIEMAEKWMKGSWSMKTRVRGYVKKQFYLIGDGDDLDADRIYRAVQKRVVAHVEDMFLEHRRRRKEGLRRQFVGIRNPDNVTCYINSSLQMLFHLPGFFAMITRECKHHKAPLASVFLRLASAPNHAIDISNEVKLLQNFASSTKGEFVNLYVQQDARAFVHSVLLPYIGEVGDLNLAMRELFQVEVCRKLTLLIDDALHVHAVVQKQHLTPSSPEMVTINPFSPNSFRSVQVAVETFLNGVVEYTFPNEKQKSKDVEATTLFTKLPKYLLVQV